MVFTTLILFKPHVWQKQVSAGRNPTLISWDPFRSRLSSRMSDLLHGSQQSRAADLLGKLTLRHVSSVRCRIFHISQHRLQAPVLHLLSSILLHPIWMLRLWFQT